MEILPKSLIVKAEMLCLTWYIFFDWILDFYRHAMYLKHALCQTRLLVWSREIRVYYFSASGYPVLTVSSCWGEKETVGWPESWGRERVQYPTFLSYFFPVAAFIFNYCQFSRSQLLPKVQAKNEEKREDSPAPVSLHLSFQTCGGSHSVWHLRSLPCWSARSSENIAERKKGTEKSSEDDY